MVCLILQLIKTQKEEKDILKDIKKNELKYCNNLGIQDDTASFWSRFLLWKKQQYKKAMIISKSIY